MQAADFYDAINSMRTLADDPLLLDNAIGPSPHNTGARLLRHGISVTAFATLEQHLDALFSEFMTQASHTPLPYSSLSEQFREFVTVDAVQGFQNRVSFVAKSDRLSYVETKISALGGFNSTPMHLSAFGFSKKGSNVSADDIRDALKAIGLDNPWGTLTALSHTMGFGRASLEEDYRNFARVRNRSAHNPTDNLPTQDLKTNLDVAVIVAVSVSVVLRALGKHYRSATAVSTLKVLCKSPVISFRFLDLQTAGTFAERISVSGRAVKIHSDLGTAVQVAKSRKDRRNVLVRATSLAPMQLV